MTAGDTILSSTDGDLLFRRNLGSSYLTAAEFDAMLARDRISPLLAIALDAAVPLNIADIELRGGPTDLDVEAARGTAQTIAERADVLMFGGGKKGEAAAIFNLPGRRTGFRAALGSAAGRQRRFTMTITMATFLRKVEAVRWDGPDAPLPDGWHPCRPEVHWGAGRRLIYFTYAGLMLRHWLGVERLPERPDSREGFAGHVGYAPADGLPPYFREWLDFTVWSVKAESQLTGDHRPVFFDPDGDEGAGMLSLWHDFCSAEQWPNPLPRYAEYRIADAKYGRGYKPVYIGVGCWLISEDGHEPRAVSDKEFERMRVAAS